MLTPDLRIPLVSKMAWMDIRRYALSYVLGRLSVFTNLDPDQLKIAGTSFSMDDLELDPSKLSSAAVTVHSAIASTTQVELSTQGLRVNIQGFNVDASINSVSPDLGLSVMLEQHQSEIDNLMEAETQHQVQKPGFMASKLSETALGQLRIDIQEAMIVLHVGDIDIQVDVGRMTFEKQQACIEGVNVTCRNSSERSPSPDFLNNEDEIFSEPTSQPTEASQEETLVTHLQNILIKHDFPVTNALVHLDSVKINTLPALSMLIACLNAFFDLPPLKTDVEPSRKIEVELRIDELLFADCHLTSEGKFEDASAKIFSLTGIAFLNDHLRVDSLNFPGLQVLAPVATVDISSSVNVCLAHPITASLEMEELAGFVTFMSEIMLIIASLKTPETDEPADVRIELPDIRLKVGDITILVIPQTFSMEMLEISEVMITTGTDRVVITSLEFELPKKRLNIRRVSGQISNDTIETVTQLREFLTLPAWETRQPVFTVPIQMDDSTRRKLSTRIAVDSIVMSGMDVTISSSLVASYNGTLRAKLKPEVVFDNHRVNSSVQLVWSADGLLLYVDVASAIVALKQLAPKKPNEKEPQPFQTVPFPIDIYVKGKAELNSPVAGPLVVKLDECLHASIKDDTINGHIPQLLVSLMDKTTEVPILEATDLHMRGNLLKNQFATTLRAVNFSCCADSFYSLSELAKYLQPPTAPVDLPVDGPDGLNVFADVDENAFSMAHTLDSSSSKSSLHYCETYYPNAPLARDGELTNLEEQPEISHAAPLDIREDYLLELRSASPKLTMTTPVAVRFRVLVKTMSWNLYDGYDLGATRKALSEAVDRVAGISDKLVDLQFENNEQPIVGDLMFNSVYIGTRPSDGDLQDEINRELGGNSLKRSMHPKVSMRHNKIKADFKSYDVQQVGEILSNISLQIEEFIVRDLVPTSKWKAVLSHDTHSRGENKAQMLSVVVETVHGLEPELRVKVNVNPLRVQLDQDTLEFITRYFEFRPENMNEAIEEEDEAEEDSRISRVEGSLRPFFQRFQISDVHICLDYRPKKVDYKGLRSGHTAEFMNLFSVERSSVVLRHLVLHGISGYPHLGSTLSNIWAPDIRDNQLANLLRGFGPLKSVFQVAGGIKKFFVVPVREYRRNDVATGLRRGSTSLAKNTANELVRLGVRIINGPTPREEDESALID